MISIRRTPIQPGDLVEVRSLSEILTTLDNQASLEGMPFMPEMMSLCGKRYRVASRCDVTCTRGGVRSLEHSVHLENVRCDGKFHQNCQARCLLFWKEDWLRVVESNDHRSAGLLAQPETLTETVDGTEAPPAFLDAATKGNRSELVCQATQIRSATCPLAVDKPLLQIFKIASSPVHQKVTPSLLRQLLIEAYGKSLLRLHACWLRLTWRSKIRRTPTELLNLTPGEFVKVRSKQAILRTLNADGLNRGLAFKPEMFRFCGQTYRILSVLNARLHEVSREMIQMKNPCILLDGVHCGGARIQCTRANYHYWHEIWLERA